MTLWIIYLKSTHPKLSKNVYVYCIIPSSLFTTISFKRAKTVRLQEPSAPFCGVLNELMIIFKWHHGSEGVNVALVPLLVSPYCDTYISSVWLW